MANPAGAGTGEGRGRASSDAWSRRGPGSTAIASVARVERKRNAGRLLPDFACAQSGLQASAQALVARVERKRNAGKARSRLSLRSTRATATWSWIARAFDANGRAS